eukprot:2303316-Lingulodinium_polyedra.AAC.1
MRRTSWRRGAGGGTNSCEVHRPGRVGLARPESMRSGVKTIRSGGNAIRPGGNSMRPGANLAPPT